MVVVGSAASVDQKQSTTDGDPVLLCVVASEGFSIIELPFFDWSKMKAIGAVGNKGCVVSTQRYVIVPIE